MKKPWVIFLGCTVSIQRIIICAWQTISGCQESIDQALARLIEITTSQSHWYRKQIRKIEPPEFSSVIFRILNRKQSFTSIFIISRQEVMSKISFQCVS